MRILFAATLAILLGLSADVIADEHTRPIYVRVNGIEAAPLLKASSEFLGGSVFIDPRLGKRRISINAEFPSKTAYLKKITALLETVAEQGPSGFRIGSRPAELQVPLPVSRKNNCPNLEREELEPAVASLLRKCEPLEYFPLESLRVLGVLGRGNEFRAIMASPDGIVWLVKVNDYMGQDYGKIFRITRSEIDLGEIKQDESGEWQEVRTLLSVE